MNSSFSTARRQQGRTLIELMVALVIGFIVLAGVLLTMSGTSNSGRRTDSMGRMLETGQIGLQLLANDMRMAGYSFPKQVYYAGRVNANYAAAGVVGCDNGFANPTTALTADLLTCSAPPTNTASSDSFSVIYETDAYNSTPVNNAGTNTPSDCGGAGIDPLPGQQGNQTVPNSLQQGSQTAYWLVENRYYIDTDVSGEPSLMCLGNSGTPPFSNPPVALVRGVQRMVVTYGIANATVPTDLDPNVLSVVPDVTQYMTADQIRANTAWAADPTPFTRWQRVTSVRLCLEVVGDIGSLDTSLTGQTPQFMNCDGNLTNITDRRLHRIVSMTVNLRNRTQVPGGGTGVIGFGGV